MTGFTASAAVLLEGGAPLELREVRYDALAAHEVLVRVVASGVCRSDLTVSGGGHGFAPPLLLGHEVSGVVERVGDAVTGVEAGDHVVACGVGGCGRCRSCRLGRPFQCLDRGATQRAPGQAPRATVDGEAATQFMGVGGFGTHVVTHESILVRMPAGMPHEAACLLGCGVATGLGAALHSARLRHGDTAVVIGCGGVGLNVVQGARLAGARRIIAVDTNPAALELAALLGATDTLNALEEDVPAAVREITGGLGATHAFEVIGRPETVQQGMASLGKGGTLYLIGAQRPDAVIGIPFGHFFEQKGVRGIAMGSTVPQVHIPEYADLYLQGRLQLDPIVASRIPLADVNLGFDRLRQGAAARSVIVFE